MSRATRRTLVSHKIRPIATDDPQLDQKLNEWRRDHDAQLFEKISYFDKYTPDQEITEAEINGDIVVVSPQFPTGDVRRYGIVPNDTNYRASNSAALVALLNPQVDGPTGWVLFINTTGTDTYYFSPVSNEIRDQVRLDLCGCTLDFAGAFTSVLDNNNAFFVAIRDVEICNGTINVNYDGSSGTNNGVILRFGGRVAAGFAGSANITEEALPHTMGNCWAHDLVLTTNNPGPEIGIVLIGGLRNTRLERILGNMGGVVEYFIYYEFGDYHYEATVANRTTSHAFNLVINDIKGNNLNTGGSNGAVVSIVGANKASVTNIEGDGCFNVVQFRCGEALFFNVGSPYVMGGNTRWHYIANVSGQNISSSGLSLVGSESASGGYLSGSGLTDAQQCDLQGFIVDGFSIDAGIYCNGPLVMRGGTMRGASSSGGLIIGEDCLSFSVHGMLALDGAGVGVRASIADSIRSSPRKKRGEIIDCKIAGNVGAGISLDLCEGVTVRECQLGYSTSFDTANEATQTSGVSVSSNGRAVRCDGNYVKTASGTAYAKTGSGDRFCSISTPLGENTYTAGAWILDGLAQASSAAIADKTDVINTQDKYPGKKLWDTSNRRAFIARGSTDVSQWDLIDGSGSVTPA